MNVQTDTKRRVPSSMVIVVSLAVVLAAAAVRAQDGMESLPRHQVARQHRAMLGGTRFRPCERSKIVEQHTTVENLVPLVEDIIVIDEAPAVLQRRTTVETVLPAQPIVEEHVVETIEDD